MARARMPPLPPAPPPPPSPTTALPTALSPTATLSTTRATTTLATVLATSAHGAPVTARLLNTSVRREHPLMALVQDDVGGLVEALEHAHDVAAVVGHDLYYLVHHAIQHGRHRCSAMGARCRAMRVAALCGATEGNRGTGRE